MTGKFRLSMGGFTLAELLVSLGIVAALCIVLAAAFGAAERKGKAVRVQKNLRSVAVSLFAYTAENKGGLISGALGPSFFAGELQSSRGPAVNFWFNALDYYMGGDDYTVQGMRRPKRPAWQQDPLKVYPEALLPGGYSVNGYAANVGFGWNHQYFGYDAQAANASKGWGSLMAQVEQPSRTIIIGTGEDSLNSGNAARNTMIYANSIRCRRHEGGGYYLFLDGHIEKLTPEEVMTNDSHLMKKKK